MAGFELPETVAVDNSTCKLSGAGVRKKFIIKVYAAGFYFEKQVSSLPEAITCEQAKGVIMHFVYRKVSASKLQDAWREGFSDNTPEAGTDFANRMEKFIALFNRDCVKGDRILITYQPSRGTIVSLNGQELGTVTGHDFMEALMKVWLGDKPADSGLKTAVTEQLG